MTYEETTYQQYIKPISTPGASDSAEQIIFQPKRRVYQVEGTIYRDGQYTLTINDITSGDTLFAQFHQPQDTSGFVRKTVIDNGTVTSYNANNSVIATSQMSSMQNKFKAMVDSLLADTAHRADCGQGLLLGVFGGNAPLKELVTRAQSQGGQIRTISSGVVEIRLDMPATLPDGTPNSIPNGKSLFLVDTTNRRMLMTGIFSGDRAVSLTSYFYNQGTLSAENTESFSKMPEGGEIRNITSKLYTSSTVNCYLNN